jgi:hypothetical protein
MSTSAVSPGDNLPTSDRTSAAALGDWGAERCRQDDPYDWLDCCNRGLLAALRGVMSNRGLLAALRVGMMAG